ncbi:nitrogenase component 1 [Fundidesulfovibrio putealis]|uniref:nitrogenase component 1 n=1 Tax=Fundidesulfovibrio putealis TaxID=270496 RepID=UPI00040023EB|nr:nitrogenase component 1 [Fundidesulfovibrio putealis]
MKTRNFVNLNVNPCKMCMPMGAAIALRGIENSMMMLHGSQGCNAYLRTHLTTHFSEPMDIASSSLHENATIYGGGANLKKGLQNLIRIYNPTFIGIATTCLAETIGEDVERIAKEFRAENDLGAVNIIATNTPGYGGTLCEGYFTTLRDILRHVVRPSDRHDRVNVVMAHVSPGDVRNIKSMLQAFGIDAIMFPDISTTFDAPFSRDFSRIPKGGTPHADIAAMSGARATIEIGAAIPEQISPGRYLEDQFGVPLVRSPIPIGVAHCDSFMQVLSSLSGRATPVQFQEDRGKLVDGMIDMHKTSGEIRALVYGDPDQVYSVASLCVENGITPAVLGTGSVSKAYRGLLDKLLEHAGMASTILDDTDFETLEHHTLKNEVNLVVGNSAGKQLTEKYGLPPVRIGFPINDRFGGQRLVYTGYSGSLKLLDDMVNAVLAKKFGMHRVDMLEKYHRVEEPAI